MNTFHDIPIIKGLIDEVKVAELLGSHIAFMRQNLLDNPCKEHVPLLIVQAIKLGSMKVENIAIAIANMDEDRHENLQNLGDKFGKEYIPIVAVFFSEGWLKVVDPKDNGPFVPPSKSPDRKEVLMYTAMTIELKTIGSIYETQRDADGNIQMGPLMNEGPDARVESALLRRFFVGALSNLRPQ